MTRWMHPPEIDRERKQEQFDPVVEGDRYGLPHDLSLAIWKRVCADATDREGRCDIAQAERRFHEIARLIAARGGRLRPDVGRLTRVATEITGVPVGAWGANELAPRVPGRETMVAVEARRWGVQDQAAQVPEGAGAATDRSELPGASEAMRAMAALQHPVQPEQAGPLPLAVQPNVRRPLGAGGAAELLAAQMRRTFGATGGDVPIATDSPRPLAAGAEGVAVGEQVYIAPGFYDLTTPEGRERLGHEVAHVLQQRRGRDLPGRISDGERTGLEAEADRAGRAFARGERFAVQGRAPAQVALFKGAAPAQAPAANPTATKLDLKSGGRIKRKSPASAAGGASGAAPAAKDKSKAEELIVSYGSTQATSPFTIERDDRGEAVRLVGSGKLSLPGSKYLKQLELDISLGPDGYVVAKLTGNATTAIKLGGLTIKGGSLTAAIARGKLSYALDGTTLSLPRNIGEGTLTIQGKGDQAPALDASLAINVPRMQPATMRFHADERGYRAEGSTGVNIKQASGSVRFSLEKVGEDKALWSAAGSVGYTSERLSGQIGVQYNADGELSGEGNLQFKIADFLTGQATVALDKEGHVAVNGEIRPPNETRLFPERKVEQTFFHKSLEFPIWGITIPAVGSVGLIAFIEGSMGYRVGVGAGVMRDIVLSGSYSTDPSVQPNFQITGEIFIPAYAELLVSIGGGIKLDAFIAEVGGGVKVNGRAGFYGGLSVRPTLAYEGGKYRLAGHALLAGDVGLSAQVDAFVRLHVGKWMFSWEKEWDWKLAEWNKWLGLNLGMEADIDYTLGQPLSPEIFKLKKPDTLDVQAIAKSAMPQGGMPPQGPKGARNQKAEFQQKGGGGHAAAKAAPAKLNTAGTPAGAAGHKNQDPKGKNVKPAKPSTSKPPKPAKGKDASQTGPAPKNNSKPSEQKLDAKPIVEQFSMHGEPHQLIVQLGPSGHVDMASKRERLSVKVGNAVGKLIAKHAPPEQVADLKAIGETAKKGDKMVATAKLPDKPGTAKVAQQIAAYGNKWQVHDLDEVALKAPKSLVVPRPVHLEKLTEALSKSLAAAHAGQVIYNKPGDPKQVARLVLEKHKDASFDFSSAKLTLPSPNAAALMTAHSVDQIGQLLAQQTGISKITIKKTEQKGEPLFELIGAIGESSATLGTAVVDNATDIKTACEQAGGVAKVKYSDVMAERQPGAVAVRPAFITGATARLKPDPKKPLEAMRNEVSGSGDKYILKGDLIPIEEIIGQQGISRVLDLPSVFNYYLDAGYKSRLKLASADDFLRACADGKFNPKTDLNNAAEIRGKVAESWWFAKARAGGVTLGQIKKDLTVMDTTYDKGMLRLNITAAELAAAHIQLHKPTAFDGMMQGWGDDPMWKAAPGSTWGLTRDGMQEGVIKASQLGMFKDRHLILPEPMPKTDEVPKALVEPHKGTIARPNSAVAADLTRAQSGAVLYQGGESDPAKVTKALLAAHPDARLDAESKTLTLPPVADAPLQAAGSLQEVAAQVAQQTGVSRVVLEKRSNWSAGLVGEINPSYTLVEITDATGSPVGEFDEVIHDGKVTDKFVEDKSARGLSNPRNTQTPAQWAKKQIYDKTAVRIGQLASAAASRPRPDGAGSPTVPTLPELQSIKEFEFAIEASNPAIQAAVNAEVANLAAAFPTYKFSAKFGS